MLVRSSQAILTFPSCVSLLAGRWRSGRQGRPRLQFHRRCIGGIDRAVRRYVVAEVSACYRHARLRLGLTDIGGINRAVSASVTQKHIHLCANRAQGGMSRVLRSAHLNNEVLRIGHISKLDGNLVEVRSDRGSGDVRASLHDGGRAREAEVGGIGKHECMSVICSTGATFDSRASRRGQVNIKHSDASMSFAGDNADRGCCADAVKADRITVSEAQAIRHLIVERGDTHTNVVWVA